jgi:hypothetical protein
MILDYSVLFFHSQKRMSLFSCSDVLPSNSRHKRFRYRKNDYGLAIVNMDRRVRLDILKCELLQNEITLLSFRPNRNYFLVCGKWRKIRRLRSLHFVNSIVFEAERNQISEAPEAAEAAEAGRK